MPHDFRGTSGFEGPKEVAGGGSLLRPRGLAIAVEIVTAEEVCAERTARRVLRTTLGPPFFSRRLRTLPAHPPPSKFAGAIWTFRNDNPEIPE